MKIPMATLAFLLGMVMSYFMGAFIGNNFNIGFWSTDGRFGCILFGVCFGGILALLTCLELEKKNAR